MMKEQYQKEVSQIHVPQELLERTKQAMKEEEESPSRRQKRKGPAASGRISLAAAAAVFLFVVIPAAAYFCSADEQTDQETQIYLSGQQDPVIGKIEKGGTEKLDIEEVTVMPDEFMQAAEAVIGEDTVFIIQDIKTGYLKAYYEKNKTGYVVYSEMTGEEEFVKALEEKLR